LHIGLDTNPFSSLSPPPPISPKKSFHIGSSSARPPQKTDPLHLVTSTNSFVEVVCSLGKAPVVGSSLVSSRAPPHSHGASPSHHLPVPPPSRAVVTGGFMADAHRASPNHPYPANPRQQAATAKGWKMVTLEACLVGRCINCFCSDHVAAVYNFEAHCLRCHWEGH
jgi:hypothetical protein